MQTKKRPFLMTLMMLCLIWSINSQAVEVSSADWTLSVNLNAIKASPLAAIIDEKHGKDDDALELMAHVFGPDFADQINEIHLYGAVGGQDDFSVLVQGDFTSESRAAFFAHDNLRIDSRDISFGNHTIQEWEINENTAIINFDGAEHIADADKELTLYVAEVGSDLIMLSRDLNDVQSWLSGHNSYNDFSQNGIFSMIVNVQEALARGGMKMGGHHGAFQSDLMKKLSQVSFSMIEDGDNMLIEAALSAKDQETTAQIQQVLNGLIALNALSNKNIDNDFGASLLSNLKIENNGDHIIVSSFAPFALIEEIREKHMDLEL